MLFTICFHVGVLELEWRFTWSKCFGMEYNYVDVLLVFINAQKLPEAAIKLLKKGHNFSE